MNPTLLMVVTIVPAAPRAVKKASRLGPASPREKAPIITEKNAWKKRREETIIAVVWQHGVTPTETSS